MSKAGKNAATVWSVQPPERNVKERIVYALIDAMRDGRLPIGKAMPAEAAMCARLGVSRVAFREAVKQLEVLGFLKISRGNGTVATIPTFACLEPIIAFLGKSNRIDFQELHYVRCMIEVEVVRLVAAGRKPALVDRLQAVVDQARRNMDQPAAHIDLDYEFHKTILEACPNRLLPLLLSPFGSQLRKSRELSFTGTRESTKTIEVHKAILDAIRRQAADRAASLMARHLADTAHDLHLDTHKNKNAQTKKPRRKS